MLNTLDKFILWVCFIITISIITKFYLEALPIIRGENGPALSLKLFLVALYIILIHTMFSIGLL